MSQPVDKDLVSQPSEVTEIAAAIADAGIFAIDLEFVSEARYIPELALVQVAWGDPESPSVAAIDPLATDTKPIVDLVADEAIEVIAHSARQDLALLAAHFGIRATRLWDTQIAAAFVGIGEQIGYAKLVANRCGASIDKASQWTDWTRRPLSEKQLAYALDDVRYLQIAWRSLRTELEERGRLEWVREESHRLSETAATRKKPEEAYLTLGGHGSLRPAALGSLRALAAWRETEAVRTNKPPSWILADAAMVELCKRQAESERDLRRARGVGPGTVRRYGQDIISTIARGAADPPPPAPARRSLSSIKQTWVTIVISLIGARCAAQEVPVRFCGTRSDAERLVHWFEDGEGDDEDVSLRHGWRRELVGDLIVDWLHGRVAVLADASAPGGLRAAPFK